MVANNDNIRLKNLAISKQNRVGRSKGTPGPYTGKDGDLHVSLLPNKGLFLHYKFGSTWYGTKLQRLTKRFIDERKVIIPNKSSGFDGSSKSQGELTRNGDDILYETSNLGTKKMYRQGDSTFVKKDLALNNVTNESKATMFTNPTITDSSGTTAIDGTTINIGPNGCQNLDITGSSFVDALAHTDFTTIKQTLNGTSSETAYDHYVFKLNLRAIDTTEWRNVYLMDLQSGTGTGDNTSRFSVLEDGSVACTEITSGAVVWKDYAFYIFRGTTNRYYHIDQDDADDYRNWDAYSTITGSNLTIGSQYIGGHFVVPENCTLKVMHGQMYNNGGVSVPTVSVFTGTPSDASDLTVTSRGTVQPNSGIALTSNKNYTFSKTDFDFDLAEGDVIIPTVHYGVGVAQTFIGSLTLKFVTR